MISIKNSTIFLLLFYVCIGFAQEKKINYTHQLQYQYTRSFYSEMPSTETVTVFLNEHQEYLVPSNFIFTNTHYITDENGTFPVDFSFNNRLYTVQDRISLYEPDTVNPFITPLNKQEKVSNCNCTQYQLTFPKQKTEEDPQYNEMKPLVVCIDEKNAIDNVPHLQEMLNFLTQSYGLKVGNIALKGLVLKIGDVESYSKKPIVLSSIKPVQEFVFFDSKEAKEEEKRLKEKALAETRIADATLANEEIDTEKIDDSAIAATEASKQAIKDVANNYMWDEEPVQVNSEPSYISAYKNSESSDDIDYRLRFIESMKRILPNYCFHIKEDMPQLKNKEAQKHLQNYALLHCESYGYIFGDVSLWKEMVDEMRYEALWLLNNQQKLHENDQKSFNNYLNSLD